MISQDHVIKKSCDFLGGTPHIKSPLSQVWWWTLVQFGGGGSGEQEFILNESEFRIKVMG